MGIRNFTTAAAEAVRDDDVEEVIEFTINGEEFVSFIPTEGQIALFTAAFAEESNESDMMASMLRFYKGILEEDSYKRLIKLMNGRPGIGLEDLMEILEYLMQEFTGHPTQPSSGSTLSREHGGRSLTDHLPPKASTRSRSPRAVSATTSTSGSSAASKPTRTVRNSTSTS